MMRSAFPILIMNQVVTNAGHQSNTVAILDTSQYHENVDRLQKRSKSSILIQDVADGYDEGWIHSRMSSLDYKTDTQITQPL